MDEWKYSDYYCPECGERLLEMPCEYCGGDSENNDDESFNDCVQCGNLRMQYTCTNCEIPDERLMTYVKEQIRRDAINR